MGHAPLIGAATGTVIVKTLLRIALLVIVLGSLLSSMVPKLTDRPTRPYWWRDVSNLKQIGIACVMYAAAHDGQFPGDLCQAFPSDTRHPEIFVTQRNRPNMRSIETVMEWTDYVYIPGHTVTSPADSVVAFLPPGHHVEEDPTEAIVLFGDGRVERMSVADFTRAMNRNSQQRPHGPSR